MDYPRLVGALALACGSRAAAEDAVQEALVRAWEREERGGPISSLTAWVTTVAFNLARSEFRRRRAELRARNRLAAGRDETVSEPTGDAIVLGDALAALPRRQREVAVLRYYLRMDVAEIAGVLGVSEGTVKSTLHLARAALAAALRRGERDGEQEDALERRR